MFLDTKGKKKY